jgi:hypothetical protein
MGLGSLQRFAGGMNVPSIQRRSIGAEGERGLRHKCGGSGGVLVLKEISY